MGSINGERNAGHHVNSTLDGSLYKSMKRSPYKDITFNELELFRRLQNISHIESILLCDEVVCFSYYGENEIPPVLKVEPFNSYIIMEKPSELKVKKGDESNCFPLASTPKKKNAENVDSSVSPSGEFEITGSPLAVHFQDAKEHEQELSVSHNITSSHRRKALQTFHGFSLPKARAICSYLRSRLPALQENDIVLPPVWIACDCNSSKIVFLGVHFDDGIMSTSHATSSGLVTGKDKLPSLDKITRHFFFGSQLGYVDRKVDATYEVFSSKELKSTIDLHCQWSRPLSILCPPGLDTSTTASLQLELTDERSQIYFLYKEFECLENFIEGFNNKCLKWIQKKNGKKVDSILKEYLDNFKRANKENTECAISIDQIVQDKSLLRQNVQFIDEVWNILKECENLNELTEGLSLIYKHLSRGIIRPRIHARNETEFAAICRDLMRESKDIPLMESGKPIELLIQIGLEKIKEDYVSILIGNGLATGDQLLPFSGWSVKNTPFSKCLEKLKKMHAVIHAMALMKSALKLPYSLLYKFTSQMLVELENEDTFPREFQFQIETTFVKSTIDMTCPMSWNFEMQSENSDQGNFGRKLKYAIKRDEDHFILWQEDDTETLDEIETDVTKPEQTKFFSICVVTNKSKF